jgi:hypothetical protein
MIHDNGTLDMVDYRLAIKGMTIDLSGKEGIQASNETMYDNNVIATYDDNGFAYSADQGFNLLYGIEQVRGSDLEGDTIKGSDANNSIWGHGGDDTLYGVAGDNYLDGGADDDLIFAGLGSDLVVGGSGDDVFRTYYDASGANDTDMFGGSNSIYGGTVTLDGSGNITSSSASGSDTVDYSVIDDSNYSIFADLAAEGQEVIIRKYTMAALTAGIVANLNAGEVEKTVGSGVKVVDTLSNIQNLVGSEFDDYFVTKVDEANIIDGGLQGSGGDTIDYSTNSATKIVLDLDVSHLYLV